MRISANKQIRNLVIFYPILSLDHSFLGLHNWILCQISPNFSSAIQQHLWQFQQQQQQQLNNNNINFKQYNGINNVNNSNNNVPQGANNKSRAGRVQSKGTVIMRYGIPVTYSERGTTAGKQTTTKRRSSCHSHGSTSAPSLSCKWENTVYMIRYPTWFGGRYCIFEGEEWSQYKLINFTNFVSE